MNRNQTKKAIQTTRVVLSFALLGALIVGVFTGWMDADLRPYGAAIGGAGAIALKLSHIL